MNRVANIEKAIAAAEDVLAQRYPDASCAFAAGSIIRGEGTTLSDIDLVVIFPRLDNAYRESFLFAGFPIEAFVHDPETLDYFMDGDVERGRPSIVNMLAEGRSIGRDRARAEGLRQEALQRLSQGPAPLAGERLALLRYEITDLLDDLRGRRSDREIRAIGAALYHRLVDLALLGRGRWTGGGKWAPRLLAAADTSLARRFDEAFDNLFERCETSTLLAFGEAELDLHGGRLFEGDIRKAAASARKVRKGSQA